MRLFIHFSLVICGAVFLNIAFINCGGTFDVKPSAELDQTTPRILSYESFIFENAIIDNLETYYKVPNAPKGVIYFFHGAGGGARSFSGSIEGRSYAEAAYKNGYAVVFVESVNRVERKWRPTLDLEKNSDLIHINNVRSFLQKRKGLSKDLPQFGVGMSNGGGFVPYVAYYFKFSAIGIYCAPGYIQVFEQEDYNIPVFFVQAENDSIVDGQSIQKNHSYLKAKAVLTELTLHTERSVAPSLFTKIPGISSKQSWEIFKSLVALGTIDSQGRFMTSPKDLSSDDLTRAYKDYFDSIKELLLETYAEHRFSSRFVGFNLEFFNRNSSK